MAVLSILLTAPLGAIGITIFGEKVLDHGERGIYRFKELREKIHLPIPGERVRSKRFGTVWKVIEQKETWMDAQGGVATDKIPAIYLRFWKEDTANGPGTGKTQGYRYSQMDPSFEDHWEILYDW